MDEYYVSTTLEYIVTLTGENELEHCQSRTAKGPIRLSNRVVRSMYGQNEALNPSSESSSYAN